jgi:hypothetical protein
LSSTRRAPDRVLDKLAGEFDTVLVIGTQPDFIGALPLTVGRDMGGRGVFHERRTPRLARP